MKQVLDNLTALGRSRLIALGVTGAAVLATVFFGLSSILAPTMVPIYSQLAPAAASEMTQTLEQAGITYDLSPDGMTVSVPEPDMARARMALADGGLPNEGIPGWELFDDVSGMGMNSFMQRVNRLRALEGELSRSIQTIDGIESARVHLVLPEREAFSRSRPDPTASVIVRSRVGNVVSQRQAMAIRALVASAVADLSGSRVTVLSASGETILAEEGVAGAEANLQSTRAAIEDRLARNVETILNARVGAGNARVQVSVDLTNEREVRRETSFDPNQQVARSVETREEDVQERDSDSGTVDVGNNIPAELQNDPGAGAQSSNTRTATDEITNYEIGSVESETVREPGEIERVSVAVLINGIFEDTAGGGRTYVERTPEELERLSQLVRSAIGFEESRGDTVSIDSMRFIDYGADLAEPVGESFATIIKNNLMSILRALFALAAIAIIMIFGAKPLRHILERTSPMPELAGAGGPAGALTADGKGQAHGSHPLLPQGMPGGVTGTNMVAPQAGGQQIQSAVHHGTILDPGHGNGEDLVQFAAVDGSVKRQKVSSVGNLVEENPDEALRVLNSWLAETA